MSKALNKVPSRMNQIFGAELRQRRKAAKLSQEHLAFKAHLHRTYISLLERGHENPTLEVFFRICEALNEEPEKFIAQIRRRLRASDIPVDESEHLAKQGKTNQ